MNIRTEAFVGVVAQDLGLFYYEVHKRSIDRDKFLPFLEALDFKFKSLPRKERKSGYVLYID